MSKPIYIAMVLDPENDDPAFGDAYDAVFRPVELSFGASTLNESFEDNKDNRSGDVRIEDFLSLVEELLESSDHTGCTPDLCVVEALPVHNLRRMMKSLGL